MVERRPVVSGAHQAAQATGADAWREITTRRGADPDPDLGPGHEMAEHAAPKPPAWRLCDPRVRAAREQENTNGARQYLQTTD